MKNKEAIQTGERFRRWFMQYAGQFAFLIILFVVLSIASPTFRTATNLINVARQVSINMIIACAMTLAVSIFLWEQLWQCLAWYLHTYH